MYNCKVMEDAIADSAARLFKPIRKVGRPIAGVAATVGVASGAYLWHINNENEKRYGAR